MKLEDRECLFPSSQRKIDPDCCSLCSRKKISIQRKGEVTILRRTVEDGVTCDVLRFFRKNLYVSSSLILSVNSESLNNGTRLGMYGSSGASAAKADDFEENQKDFVAVIGHRSSRAARSRVSHSPRSGGFPLFIALPSPSFHVLLPSSTCQKISR